MPVVTVKLNSIEFQQLKAEAHRRGKTQSETLREGLKSMVDVEVSGSLTDRMQDLLGTVVGPEDLSTNPAYQEEYGKESHR